MKGILRFAQNDKRRACPEQSEGAQHDSFGSRHDTRRLDAIELGEILVKIRLAFVGQSALIRPVAARSALAIATVELIHDLHALDDLAEGRKALCIQAAVVPEIDEN